MQTNDHPPYRVQEVRGLKERRKRKRGKKKEKKKKKKTWHTTRAPESRLSGQFAPIKPNAAPRSGLEGKQAMATIGEDASRHGKPAIFTFHNYPFPSLSLSSKRSSSSECVVARPPPFGTILFCSPRDCPAGNYCLFSGHHSKLLEDFRNFQPLFRFSRCLVFFSRLSFFSPRFVYFSFGFQCVYRSRFVRGVFCSPLFLLLVVSRRLLAVRKAKENYEKQGWNCMFLYFIILSVN